MNSIWNRDFENQFKKDCMIILGKPQLEDEKNNIFSSDESESNEVSRCAKSTSKVTDNT